MQWYMDLILKKNVGKDTRLSKKNLVNIKTTKKEKQISIKQAITDI